MLVGGAATAIHTDGLFPSGGFDIIAPDDQAFAACMAEHGFRLEDRPGKLLVGWHHPAHPGFGFQQVYGPLFDGRSDESRVLQVIASAKGEVTLPAIEDFIADRLGQHAAASPTDISRLRQAQALFNLAGSLDETHLSRRIRDENGDPALLGAVQQDKT